MRGWLWHRGATVAMGAVIVAFAWSLCIRSLSLGDEGAILSQSFDLLRGRLLYRDMDAMVTPGIWFLLAGTFELLGASVLASRIPVLIAYLALLGVSYRIVVRLASRAWAWAAVGAMVLTSVWAFPAWTFAFYSPFSVLFALAGAERLLSWQALRRPRDLLSAGLLLGLSVAFKQNYGVLALTGGVASLLALHFQDDAPPRASLGAALKDVTRLAAGVAVVPLAVVAYFASQHALAPLYESLVVHPFEFAGLHPIAYLELSRLWDAQVLSGTELLTYGSFPLSQTHNPFAWGFPPFRWLAAAKALERLHVLLYWLPPVIIGTGAFLALRPGPGRGEPDSGLLLLTLVAGFLYLGVFPRADFNHLINVYQPLVVTGVVTLQRLASRHPSPRSRRLRAAAGLGGAILALYVYVSASWYVSLLRNLDTPVRDRGGVLVSTLDAGLIDFHVATIRSLTRPQDAVLTLPSLSMLNFLTERPVPSRYYNTWAHDIAHDGGTGVRQEMEAKHVDLVVHDYNNFFSDKVGLREYAPVLASYLRAHFEPLFDVANNRFGYRRRRPVPVPDRPALRFLRNCEIADEAMPHHYVREHLLVPILYQIPDRRMRRHPVETLCPVVLPAQAELTARVGYREPTRVMPGSELTAEIWAETGRLQELVWSQAFAVEPQRGWVSEPRTEIHVDLSRFGAREVTLIFRTLFRGAVKVGALDVVGFAMLWEDPRLETRE